MSLEIKGFNDMQKKIADQLWQMETAEQIEEFFRLLPRKSLQDAYTVHQMMMWACRDSFEPDDYEAANWVIERVRNLS